MRTRSLLLLLASALIVSTAAADYGTPPPPPPSNPNPSSSLPPGDASASTARQQAEGYFSDGYKDVVKAGKDLEHGKKDNAIKKYRRARERCEKAVEIDSTYHEAWNLIGFTSRKLGEYPKSFEAYRTALRIKPDFALALEYYGEGLLETGDLAGARQQLTALKQSGTPELIAELEGAITKYVAAHPETASASAPAPAANGTASGDSSATKASGQ